MKLKGKRKLSEFKDKVAQAFLGSQFRALHCGKRTARGTAEDTSKALVLRKTSKRGYNFVPSNLILS